MRTKPAIKLKPLMINLSPDHAAIFEKEAKKIALPTSAFMRMILIQWLGDTGKLDGHIETKIEHVQEIQERI